MIETRKEIKIAVHNINGLKGNRHKIEPIVERIEKNEYDIIGIVETNITNREGQFIVKQRSSLNSFWSNAEEGKNKGSGVGIIVSDKWAKHIGQIRKHNGYLIEVHFFFKQLEIVVFTVYIAPNDQMKRKEAQRIIMKEIAQKKQNMHFIIMGDFNHIMQPNLDRSNSNNNNYKKLPLHGWMLKQDFIDTFRAKYPNRREFTWSNGKDNTRIDQIWVSSILSYGLDDAIIEDMNLDTGSDHKLVVARLILDYMQIKDSLSQVKRKGEKRIIFEYDKATKEN